MHAHRAALAYHLQDCSGGLGHLDLHGQAREGVSLRADQGKFQQLSAQKYPKNISKSFWIEAVNLQDSKLSEYILGQDSWQTRWIWFEREKANKKKKRRRQTRRRKKRRHTQSASGLHQACNFNRVSGRRTKHDWKYDARFMKIWWSSNDIVNHIYSGENGERIENWTGKSEDRGARQRGWFSKEPQYCVVGYPKTL